MNSVKPSPVVPGLVKVGELHAIRRVGTQKSREANALSATSPDEPLAVRSAVANDDLAIPTAKHDAPARDPVEASADENIIVAFGELPPGTILTKAALARLFSRTEVSIDRAVQRGELPHPAKLLGTERWTAGAVVRHHEQRMAEAAEDAAEIARQHP